MPTRRGRVIIAGLAIVAIVSLWRAVAVEREKHRIADAYVQAQQLVKQLDAERASLHHELEDAHQTIDTKTNDLTSLKQQYQDIQTRLEKTSGELTFLQQQHDALRQQNASLASEKQQLEAKLSSLKELRLAIHDVKRKIWNERFAAWRARIETQKASDQERLASGNHGYVVREGASTLGSSESSGTKLRVHVLEPQSQ